MICSEIFKTELAWRPPEDFLGFASGASSCVMLDSGGESPEGRWSWLCPRPASTLVLRQGVLKRDGVAIAQGTDVWSCIRAMLRPRSAEDLPFPGGVIGLASYEAGMRLERIASRHMSDEPELIAMLCDDFFAFDRQEKRLWWVSHSAAPVPEIPVVLNDVSALPSLTFTPDLQREAWIAAVKETIRRIGEGEIFQANLTARFSAFLSEHSDPAVIWRKLRQTSPAPFGAFLKIPDFSLLSASVERFIALTAAGYVSTRPIKGTAPISDDPDEDRSYADGLKKDEKEYAENLMITDLMRNDIGRVCLPGSVTVPQLCGVERFAHVHHLVSEITGQLRNDVDAFDLLRATLPPGSVTGAPKHRAMQMIDALEGSARGVYCGSLFRIGHDGSMDSSVIIRSMSWLPEKTGGGTLRIGAGGGITWPSIPEKEYDEMCLKAEALIGLFSEK